MPNLRSSHKAVGALVVDAVPKGAIRISAARWRWNVAGRCEKPVDVELQGRPAANWLAREKTVLIARGTAHTLFLELQVPCRKCTSCHRARTRLWTARAMHEVREANRTWFATLTLRPEAHYAMQCRAIAHAESRAIPPDDLSPEEIQERATSEIAKEITLFLKRVRKKTGSQSLRYLMVRENHKTGLPHFHMLVHERGEPITRRSLQSEWDLGFSKFKLVEETERASLYVVKYLHKADRNARVRSSIRYGRWSPSGIADKQSDGGVPLGQRSEASAGLGEKTSQKHPDRNEVNEVFSEQCILVNPPNPTTRLRARQD